MKTELLHIFKQFGLETKLIEIEEFLSEHKKRFIAELRPRNERPKRLFGQNILNYIQMALIRSSQLIEGSLNGINSKNLIVSALCTRAHYEITGGVAYLLNKAENFYDNRINEKQFEDSVFRLIMGTKDTILHKKYEDKYKNLYGLSHNVNPVNVLSMIEVVDKYAKKYLGENLKAFKNSYDILSEFCHPNSLTFQLCHEIDNGIVRYYTEPKLIKENLLTFCNYLLMSAPIFILFYDKTFELLENKEELPIIIRHKI